MRKSIPEKTVKLKDDLSITFYPIGKHANIFEIDEAEAEKFSEAPVQILESRRYQYKLSNPNFQLVESEICTNSKEEKSGRGFISPGNYVGTLELEVENYPEKLKFYLEVLATKFGAEGDYDKGYRENYRSMIEDITEKCTELLMQSNSPINQYFKPDFNKKNKTLYQKFSFVKSVLNNPEFDESILKIFSSPKTNWIPKEEPVDIRSIKRFSNKNIKEILKGTNRIPLPKEHYLYSKRNLESLPAKIDSYKQEASLDNPENRFIKHALQLYLQFCTSCNSVFKKDSRDQKEAKLLIQKLERYLNHSFFNEISRPATLRLNSPTLQRKGGYRQQLRFWLMFDLASKLTWTGGEDIYKAGKRDIATLYEYWLFFVLYDLFKVKFQLDTLTHNEKPYDHLLEKTKNGINLIVKSGKHTALKGTTVIKNRALNIKFSFNRSFSGNKDSYPNAGSWTTAMRPDYTLTVWPNGLTEANAELKEEIVHIHFDAKYKVRHFTIKTNEDESKLSEKEINKELKKIKKQERKGVFKNIDLLKMHAYKDAIRRTGGAYILYPGTTEKKFRGFHELLPGLGAFSMNPETENEDVRTLSQFIDKVVLHLVDRSSQRENIAAKTFEITNKEKTESFHAAIPEYINEKKLILDESFVLVGYYKSEKHLEWIRENLLYNFRMDSDRGALKLDYEAFNSKYLLLYGKGNECADMLFEIKDSSFTVTSKKTLETMDYPDPRHSNYLVISIQEIRDKHFENLKWKFESLNECKSRNVSIIPFTVSLRDLITLKMHKNSPD